MSKRRRHRAQKKKAKNACHKKPTVDVAPTGNNASAKSVSDQDRASTQPSSTFQSSGDAASKTNGTGDTAKPDATERRDDVTSRELDGIKVAGRLQPLEDAALARGASQSKNGRAPENPSSKKECTNIAGNAEAAPAKPAPHGGISSLPTAGLPKKTDGDSRRRQQQTNGSQEPIPGGSAKASAAQRVQNRSEQDYRAVLTKGLTECRANLISVGIFSFILNLLVLAIPIYLFQVSDRVLTSRSLETLIMLTVVVIGALLIYALLDVVRRYLLMRVAMRLETTLGAPVLSAAAKSAQIGSTREFQTISDVQQLRSFITGPTLLAMFDAPVAPVYFLVVYLIHPQLGLIVTVAALVITTIAFINQRVTAVPFARANAFSQRANFQAEALARNAQVVNAMGMIREGVILWGRETSEALKAQVSAQDRNVRMTGLSKFLRLSTQVAMLGWGAYLAVQGQLTGGMMIAASIIGSRALAPVEGLIEGWRGYVQARGGYARIKALLDSTPLNVDRLRLPRPQGRLQVERVLYVPPPTKKVILNGINFDLNPGESLAVVGPSGTGKSTLARMLVGSIAPTSGAVRLDLMDIRNWDPRQFGETVGYLPQDVLLFPATIKANIARLREDVSDESIFDAAELAGVHELISQMPHGYETQVGMDGSPLSGGQKQRLGLARAFFGNPRLVVLDEPNSNLDTAGENALSAALLRAKKRQITVIAVTQRPALLKNVDKIMLLKEGRIQNLDTRDVILPTLMGTRRNVASETAH